MLVKNDKEWCWCLGEYVGYPQKSIEDAVKDFADTYFVVLETINPFK